MNGYLNAIAVAAKQIKDLNVVDPKAMDDLLTDIDSAINRDSMQMNEIERLQKVAETNSGLENGAKEPEKKLYWYEVIIRYIPNRNNGNRNVHSRYKVAVENQYDILNARKVKLIGDNFATDFCKRSALALSQKNGNLDLEIVGFLGHFENKVNETN